MNKKITLLQISKLAKTDKILASKYILSFVKKIFNLDIVEIKINSSAVSLNSVNWFIVYRNGREDFFKFHSEEWEEDSVWEYYRAGVLEKAGFPVISPKYESSKSWEQFLIYEKIEDKTVYDFMWEIDEKFLENWIYDDAKVIKILKAEEKINKKCIKIAEKTLKVVNYKEVENESIWQLFYWRLKSEKTIPRIDLFYKNKEVILPNWEKINFEEFKKYKWIINWKKYSQNLEEIITDATKILNPKSREKWPVITAHGDDHNWNKFFINEENIKYFDPAFASKNVPALLAFIKTTFHDVFAHPLYLYEPNKIEKYLKVDFKIDYKNKIITFNNNFSLDKQAPFRKELLKLKFKTLWKPLIDLLKEQNLLEKSAKEFIKKALFCCPFLAVNLINYEKFSSVVSMLAISIAIELWTSTEESEIDKMIDSVF